MQINQIRVERQTLGDSAYKAIRDQIISLKLEPGQMIFENELASSLGVSRTPVREAFLRLRKEKLIDIFPQRGARVEYISLQKVEEARFVRESLEISVFKEVSRNWNPNEDHWKNVRSMALQLIDEQRNAATSGDWFQFLSFDEAFHHLILKQIGNSTLISVVSEMRGHLNRMRILELKEARHMNQVVEQHEALLDAVAINDDAQVEEMLKHHLRHLKADLPKIIERNSSYFESDGTNNF